MSEKSTLRSLLFAGTALLCVLGTGCPHDWMKEGTNDKALRRDVEEELEDMRHASMPCPEGQSRKEECKQNAEGKITCEWICR